MKRVLVTYFSHSGNTKRVAEKISNIMNGELFEIKTVSKYPVKYNLVVIKQRKSLLRNLDLS